MVHQATGVVLMAYGGPERLEEIPAFLDDILGKGWISDEHLEEITERYRAIGGGSPITAITRRQAESLERRLADAGRPWPAAVGMRHSEPFISEAVSSLVGKGCSRLVGLTVSPHTWTDAYRRALVEAADSLREPPEIVVVEGWHTNPSFLDAWADSVKEAWEAVPVDGQARATLIFTAHSLPVSVAAGSPYEAQLLETIEGVMERVYDRGATAPGMAVSEEQCRGSRNRPDDGGSLRGAGRGVPRPDPRQAWRRQLSLQARTEGGDPEARVD
ncbi:MAG: ferrochelatase [Nitrospinae bacterium]|nr:ferrochelatase [Nitrospinota bacterium]